MSGYLDLTDEDDGQLLFVVPVAQHERAAHRPLCFSLAGPTSEHSRGARRFWRFLKRNVGVLWTPF